MKQYEYKTIIYSIDRKSGLWTDKPDLEGKNSIENSLNQLGKEGWRMVGVFPVTEGGSPAQIDRALHYFMREIEQPGTDK